jgi:putative DNA primase/helicase
MIAGIDFDGINAAALRNGRSVVQDFIPGGKFCGLEYIAKNPRRNDERPGSFSINYRSGVWKDFATDDGGSDIVSLVAYVKGEAVGEMAERRHVAIVGITHFSKSGQRAINAFLGSIAFIAAARAAFAVMKDDTDESRHLFLPVKNNLAPLGEGIAFRLEQHMIPGADGCGPASAVSWDSAPVTATADQVMAANAGTAASHTAKADCIEFLEKVLADGWTEVVDVTAEAISAGLHAEGKQLKDNKPMRDARVSLKVETRRDGFGKGARWFWALPGTPWESHRRPQTPEGALPHERAPMDLEGRL